MAIAMVAMLAFGGTYAYFTAQAKTLTTGELTIGEVKLTSDTTNAATVTASGTIVPGAKIITGNINYINESSVDTIVAVVMSIKIDGTQIETIAADATVESTLATYGITLSTTDVWATPVFDSTLGGFVYTLSSYVLDDTAESVQFTDKDVTFNANEHYDETNDKYTAGLGGADLTASIQGKKIEISITAYQSQLLYAADGQTVDTPKSAADVIADMKTALGK